MSGRRALVVVLALLSLGAVSCGGAAAPSATTAPPSATSPSAAPFQVAGPGRYEGELVSGGLLRRFVLVVPESVPTWAPLVLAFHGFAGSPAALEETSGLTRLAQRRGFVLVYPEASGHPRAWQADPRLGDRDVRFVRDLVSLLTGRVSIDPSRVYAAGLSNGGGMAARLACDAADLFAAVATVAGAYPTGACDPERAVPVVAFHGTADPIVPYGGWGILLPPVEGWAAGWAERDGCDPSAEVRVIGDDVTSRTWGGCRDQAQVVLYTIAGGGHGWPGSGRTGWGGSTDTIDASALAWEFFALHPRP